MRTLAIAGRILKQIIHDKRTMALILAAPLLVLGVVYFILISEATDYTIGCVGVESELKEKLESNEDYDITIESLDKDEIETRLFDDTIHAVVEKTDDTHYKIYLSGTDASVAVKMEGIIKTAKSELEREDLEDNVSDLNEKLEKMGQEKIEIKDVEFETEYVVVSDEGTLFDKFGSQLVGIIVFFFVFLIAGINFLGERNSGTLEKLLSTPVRRSEIIMGYILGFGVLALLQSVLITAFSVYVLGLSVEGNVGLVMLITLLTAISALAFGILLSTIANSEFQMMQFIPIVILPQVFLCGLFRVEGIWGKLGYIMPVHYSSHGLTEVMLKGSGLEEIALDVLVLSLFSVCFIFVNILLLKKQRKI